MPSSWDPLLFFYTPFFYPCALLHRRVSTVSEMVFCLAASLLLWFSPILGPCGFAANIAFHPMRTLPKAIALPIDTSCYPMVKLGCILTEWRAYAIRAE